MLGFARCAVNLCNSILLRIYLHQLGGSQILGRHIKRSWSRVNKVKDGLDSGPTYVLIVAMCIVGVLASFVIFKDSGNSNVPIIIGAIVSLAGLAYGLKVKEDGKATS